MYDGEGRDKDNWSGVAERMSEIKILIEGYAKPIKNGFIASSTTVLIREKGLNIIVDPGINKRLLIEKLAKEKIKTDDIDYVILSHYHLDHALNASLFSKAKIIDATTIYSKDKEFGHSGFVPKTKIRIIPTPGHADEMCSIIVPTKKGTYAIAADNFWWTTKEKQRLNLKKRDPFMNNYRDLIKSRKKLLKIADYIIPGHGQLFKVKK